MNVRASGHLDDTTRAVWRRMAEEYVISFFFCCFIMSEEGVSAALLLTPETLEVFCGLKHFTQPSIGE